MPAAPMIRETAATSLSSSVLRWSFRVVGVSVRIVVLSMIALFVAVTVSAAFAADVYSTSRSARRRKQLRQPLRRAHTSTQSQTLELPGY